MELYYQRVVESWLRILWCLVAVVSILAGYLLENQAIAWYANLAMMILSTIIVVPEWQVWQGRPTNWRGVVLEDISKKKE